MCLADPSCPFPAVREGLCRPHFNMAHDSSYFSHQGFSSAPPKTKGRDASDQRLILKAQLERKRITDVLK